MFKKIFKEKLSEALYRNIIVGDSIKKQALITAEFDLLASLVFLIPDFPFSRSLVLIPAGSSVVYFLFYLFYDKIPAKYFLKVTGAMSVMAFVLLGIAIHLSGGITSPFIYLFFCVLILENIGGISSVVSLPAAILSYFGVVSGEFYGFLQQNNYTALAIYSSPATTFILAVSTISFMATIGYSTSLVVRAVSARIEKESLEKEIMMRKYLSLETISNIGMISHRVIHDMRTPLTLVYNYLGGLKKNPETLSDEKTFNYIREVLLKISDSMNDIITYGKTGELKIERSDITETVKGMISIMKFYSGKDIEFGLETGSAGGFFIKAVSRDVYNILFNIIKNAVQALSKCKIGEKKVSIKIYSSRPYGEEEKVVVEVFNNGPVLEKDQLEKAFNQSFTDKPDGSGLGLMIIKDLIDKNGGEVKIENKGEKYGVLVTAKFAVWKN